MLKNRSLICSKIFPAFRDYNMSENLDKNQNRIRVLLVDDHTMMRQGVQLCLRQEPDLEIVGEAGDGSAALRLAAELRPAVIVMDIVLPDADGVELARQILSTRPEVRIVILAGLLDRRHLRLALASSIAAYVLKTDAMAELAVAIRKAARNENYVSPSVAAMLVEGYKEILAVHSQENESSLSEREIMVLKLIGDGLNTKDIAGELGLSVKTVETHRIRTMIKLGLHSVAELTKYALRKGLTSP